MFDYLDKEEKEIIESLHAGEWVSDFDDSTKKMYEEAARFSLKGFKEVSVSISQQDFQKIQAKALEEGVTYQAMISMLIHKFNEGEVEMVR